MIRKNATLTGIIISMIIGIGIFIGLFTWLNTNATDSGVTVSSEYNETQYNLELQTDSLGDYFNEIKSDLSGIVEAEDIYSSAINGFKGLGKILLSPIKIIDYAVSSFFAVMRITQLPQFVKTLLSTAILGVIILLVIAIVKGEQDKM